MCWASWHEAGHGTKTTSCSMIQRQAGVQHITWQPRPRLVGSVVESWLGSSLLGSPWKFVTISSKLVYKLFRGRIQPTYKGIIIYLLKYQQDIPVCFQGNVPEKNCFQLGTWKFAKKKIGEGKMHLRKPAKLLGFFESLRILAHLLKMMIGVYNHLRNERYLGSMKPFSEGEPGSLGKIYL